MHDRTGHQFQQRISSFFLAAKASDIDEKLKNVLTLDAEAAGVC
jgi:hypothetical protein